MPRKNDIRILAPCQCDMGMSLIAWVVMALGLWFLAGGFIGQFNGFGTPFDWSILVWYFLGVVLLSFGKMWYVQSCVACDLHAK